MGKWGVVTSSSAQSAPTPYSPIPHSRHPHVHAPQFGGRLRVQRRRKYRVAPCKSPLQDEIRSAKLSFIVGRLRAAPCRKRRQQAHAAAQTKNRIQDCPGRIRQGPVFHHGNRIGRCVAPSQKSAAISFILDGAHQISFNYNDVNAPDGLVGA